MELDVKDYFNVIRKRLMLIVTIVLVCTLTTGLLSYFVVKPVYEVSVKLIVNKSNDRSGIDQIDINSITTNLRLIDTYKEIMKTPAIMDSAAMKYPELQLTSEELLEKIKVSSVNNTQVMTLAFQDQDHERAVKIVNALSKTFQQEIPKIMKVDNVTILNEAKSAVHPIPVKPNQLLNIAIACLVSLLAALGVAFLLEYLDDTIKTEEDVERDLGLPVLTVVTKMKGQDLVSGKGTSQMIQAGEGSHVTFNR